MFRLVNPSEITELGERASLVRAPFVHVLGAIVVVEYFWERKMVDFLEFLEWVCGENF